MPDDLERRLRDSLHAYADLVEAPDDDALPTGSAAPRPVLRRWHGAVLAAAAAAAVVTGSVWVVGDRDSGGTSAAGPATLSTQEDTRADASPSDSGAAAAESGALADSAAPVEGFALSVPLQPGVAYPVYLSTHCGIRGLDVGGTWFAAVPPMVTEGGHPPSGWDDPEQRGTVTLLSPDEAVFRDDAGHEVQLHADESARPPLCD